MEDIDLDDGIGSADMAWLLALLFFITSVVALRPSGLAVDVSADQAAKPTPGIDLSVGADGEPHVTSAGVLGGPDAGEAVESWLGRRCDDGPLVVRVGFPPEATHGWCREQVSKLMSAAPSCKFQY